MTKNMYRICLCVLVAWLGCAKKPSSYYPLEEGRSWEYQLSTSSLLSVGVGATRVVITNLPSRELNGQKVVPQKAEIGNVVHFTFIASHDDGIYELGTQSPRDVEPQMKQYPECLISFPLEVGRMWQIETETSLLMSKTPVTLEASIESINETVTVPAGTFDKCVRVTATGTITKNLGAFMGSAQIDVEHRSWYAPDVGLIKSSIKEKSNHMMVGSGDATIQLAKIQ